MQRNMREKELLLREIHHRVKNNLQLIASILNMQIRTVNDPEARRILTRVQERVMSLSAIHKALYSGERVDSIRADLLLAELIDGVLNVALPRRVGAEVTVDLEPVRLDPDRLVPLSLLVTEAVTNAARHLGTTDGRPLSVAVSLAQEGEDGTIVFTTENSRGPDRVFADASDGSALGTRLIEAFAGQLAGNVSIEEDATRHRLELRFRPDAVGH
jgi:two-component sensor histidine kinase